MEGKTVPSWRAWVVSLLAAALLSAAAMLLLGAVFREEPPASAAQVGCSCCGMPGK